MPATRCFSCGRLDDGGPEASCPGCGYPRTPARPLATPPPVPPELDERIYLDEDRVLVTNRRLVTGTRTWDMTRIQGARVSRDVPVARLPSWGWGGIALVVLVLVAGTHGLPWWIFVAVIFGMLRKSSHRAPDGLALHQVLVNFDGNEELVWATRDEGFARRIASAIDEARAG